MGINNTTRCFILISGFLIHRTAGLSALLQEGCKIRNTELVLSYQAKMVPLNMLAVVVWTVGARPACLAPLVSSPLCGGPSAGRTRQESQ